jgi:hypothetical protein
MKLSLDMRINLRAIYRRSTLRSEPLITCEMEKDMLMRGKSVTYLLVLWDQGHWNARPFIFAGFRDDNLKPRGIE